ncbi:MAG: MBL fold metallo-hydrolase [Lysobacterales bacterium]
MHLDCGDGVTMIDTGLVRPGFDACYLIEHHGIAALWDTGTQYSVSRVLDAIDAVGLEPEAVRYVIPSHVHLDHASGTGALIEQLPAALVLAHPRAVRHLADPSRLQASAEAVYGADVVASTYGRLQAVPAERIRAVADGERLDLAGRVLRFMDAPGHARHHVTLYDESSRSWFTGDCFGISYRDFDGGKAPLVFPTTSPTQFDPPALKATINRMLETTPRAMYLTHFGRLEEPERFGPALFRLIDAQIDRAREILHAADPQSCLNEALHELFAAELHRIGSPVDATTARQLLAIDADLNAQGVLGWLGHAG